MRRSRLLSLAVVCVMTGAAWTGAAPAALATAHTTCRIAVTDLGATLKIVFTARSPVPSRPYGVRITVDGESVFSKRLRTDDDSRLRVRLDVQDGAGLEVVQGRAREIGTGSVCMATVAAPA